ncbi:hypothetical protein OIU77_019927 [Salix suchowensis]|uniref:WPP domain-containing protein n=1 Tax=Salix suchowensis TaxID=1278906 RepID=A0ABQ9CME0_9ROSI|nr:hypothetical protein OIU77_019927 [Salix suchowensis]
MDSVTQSFQHRMSVKLWPPIQSTRLMLVERMTKNFITPSFISRKYGLLNKEEAEEAAKKIEEMAFAAANQHHEKEPDGDGSSAVQIYAKESSRLMLEVLKGGPKTQEDEDVKTVDEGSAAVANLFDISGGRREFISGEEAEELLKPLKVPGNSYTRICFSNRSFGLDAAHVAKSVLLSIKGQLTGVDLSDCVAGRPESEALEVMEEAARAVCELIPSTEKLKVLHFHNNMTGDEGAAAIAEMLKQSHLLEDFRCSSTRVGLEGGVALAEALGSCSHLRKLDLRDNMFGVEAGIALSKSLFAFAGLTEVYLSYLNLEDEGAEALANALKESAPSLEILDMAGNDITAKGASSLAACIMEKQFLTNLNLAENELKDEGAILIAKAIEDGHDQLNEVDLSTNAIRRAGARLLAQAVVHKPGFKSLNINGNYISDEGIDEVKDIFKSLPDVLGKLDENDPEGEDLDEDAREEDGDVEDEDELESKLKGLEIKL